MKKDEKHDVIWAWHHIGEIEQNLDGLPGDQLPERRDTMLQRVRIARWLLRKHFSEAEYAKEVKD